ncbi:RIO1 family regulatory kinase/ATPase [Bacillus sp. JJ1533]|uniref:RIO1 family regulatory kinase/ATPase domain-containing protein n=1 Tax=Bacillus sp. JJ1533 TaxID=3122959 RepID=UPI002FFD85E4
MENFKSIRVLRKGDNEVEIVHNPTSFPLIGKGKQGAVFKLSSDQCVKVYANQVNVLKESEVLKAAQESGIVPNLYEVGENYIIMEYIEGSSIKEYLESKGNLTEDFTRKILSLLQEMKRLKFTRLDVRFDHLIVTKQGELKVIDHVNSFSLEKQSSRPVRLLKCLKKLGLLSQFLEHVKIFDPQSYLEWRDSKRK